jgi:uncharacterized protein YndB with AHSA1/START domain
MNNVNDDSPRIRVSATVKAPIDSVWQAYTTPADIVEWNAASDDWNTTSATVDLRVGGSFSSRMEARDGSGGFDFSGTYRVVELNERIEYEFGGRHAEVIFAPSAEGTRVTVAFDAEQEHPLEMQRDGWQAILDRFASYVEQSA